MSKADRFKEWCSGQDGTALQFVYDDENHVTGVVKKVHPSLLPVYEALQDIESPVLPCILDTQEKDDTLFITEEYIDGRSLRFLLDEDGAQDDAFTLRAAKDIAEALTILHGKIPPIIHRDIKPENVILRENGRFVLIDFDAARGYSETSQTDTVNLGTHGYASPEQYGFAQSDARSDIYSLGVLLYELRMGERFQLGAVCEGTLSPIVQKCTEFEPKNRYQTAEELLQALSQPFDQAQRGNKRKLFIRWGMGAAAIIAVGVAFLLLRKQPEVEVSPSPSSIPTSTVTPPTPQGNDANTFALLHEDDGEIPCTCVLASAADPDVQVHYSPDPMGAIGLLSGETQTKTLAVDTPRIADGCKAEVHDEPEYTYSLVEYIPPKGQDALLDAVGDDNIVGDQIKLSAPGRYKVRYHTVYHDQGYGADFYVEAYSISNSALKGRSLSSVNTKEGERIPCTCILEDPLGPKSNTKFQPHNVDLPRGQTLVRTLEVPPAIIYDCEAPIHDKPTFTYEFHQYLPPEGQEQLKNTVGPDIVDGDQITLKAPGKYYVWFETYFHGMYYRAGYSFFVYDAPEGQAATPSPSKTPKETATTPSPSPQDSAVNASAANSANTSPCTCTLELLRNISPDNEIFGPKSFHIKSGETIVKTLEVRPIRIADNCKAAVHDEPTYTFSLDEYVPPKGQEALKDTVKKSIVKGNQITISAPGHYYVKYETRYHGEGYRASFGFEVGETG